MKKNKIVIITLILGILFLTSYLYSSYATSTGVSLGNDENTYDILLNDSTDTVTVPAKSSKTIYYQFSNTNKGTIKYHIGYTSSNVTAKVWWDTEDPISGTIEQGEYKFIKLKLINDTTSDDTITIKPILGYVNGGDLVVPNDTKLITGTINEVNTMSIGPGTALTTLGIAKTAVEEISFVNDNIVPSDVLGSTTVSADNSVMLWYTASDTEDMYKVYIGSDNGITSLRANSDGFFRAYTNMISINLNNIDTSNVINMAYMFRDCSSLTSLDVGSFNTSNVTNMTGMFSSCTKLKTLDLSNFNTSNVTSMNGTLSGEGMFDGCRSLTSLDLSNFNTANIANMAYMFRACNSLTSLDVGSFNTSKATNMREMFRGCSNLTSLNLSNFDTSKVANMSYMFTSCRNLTNLDLSTFNTSSLTTMNWMFQDCSKLTTLNISNFDTSRVTSMDYVFQSCSSLTAIDMRNADLSSLTSYDSMFWLVPTSATIYLKDIPENINFMNEYWSTYTNVQYIPSS